MQMGSGVNIREFAELCVPHCYGDDTAGVAVQAFHADISSVYMAVSSGSVCMRIF